MKYTLSIPTQSSIEFEFSDMAHAFAEQSSNEQSVFLYELFDALKFRCKNDFNYQKQLNFIATDIKSKNMKELIKTIEDLNYFLQDDDIKEQMNEE